MFCSEFLIGVWALNCSIRHRDGLIYRYDGLALATKNKDGAIHFCEKGTMHQPNGGQNPISKESFYQVRPDGFTIYFDEALDQIFHQITLRKEHDTLKGTGIHHCAQDIYKSEYSFLDSNRFEIRHTVSGPRKDYISHSEYVRTSPEGRE